MIRSTYEISEGHSAKAGGGGGRVIYNADIATDGHHFEARNKSWKHKTESYLKCTDILELYTFTLSTDLF